MNAPAFPIVPVILSGGSGFRLWPLSCSVTPKQYWAFTSEHTLLQETILRVAPVPPSSAPSHSSSPLFKPALVICNYEHRFLVAEQFRSIDVTPQKIITESASRNTAAAITLASLFLSSDDLVLVLPADHSIQNPEVLHQAILFAIPYANAGHIVTFGVKPNRSESRFGYIQKGDEINLEDPKSILKNIYKIKKFIEKPDAQKAQQFIAQGDYFWNSGIFLFKAKTLLSELDRIQPALTNECRKSLQHSKTDEDFVRIDSTYIDPSHNQSIDYALMEKTDKGVVIPVEMEWHDLGTWDALWKIAPKNKEGNVTSGRVFTKNVNHSYIRSEFPLVSVLGLDNVTVVATKEGVLVAHQNALDHMREMVADLDV